jgi:excisionase family DNA binding protein
MKKTLRAKGANLSLSTPTTQAEIAALKLKPAAQYLGGLSVPTMHRLIKRGMLRPCRATRHLLFPIEELDRFLKS